MGLREFAGTLTQFKDVKAIETLIKGAGAAQVASLAKRIDLVNNISTHTLRGEFISNVNIDGNGTTFLKSNPNIAFVGKDYLVSRYISDAMDVPVRTPASDMSYKYLYNWQDSGILPALCGNHRRRCRFRPNKDRRWKLGLRLARRPSGWCCEPRSF